MTASKSLEMAAANKYYFRKKSGVRSVLHSGASNSAASSTESEDNQHSETTNQSCLTLHVIADPGQSEALKSSFRGLICRLDPRLDDVICVSESGNPSRLDQNNETKGEPQVPAVGILLFFYEPDSSDKSEEIDSKRRASAGGQFTQVRQIFTRPPWSFHHRVAISGKLMSCDSNAQDYFSYAPTPQTRDQGRATPMPLPRKQVPKVAGSYPIWGVRKVHYGRQILRVSLFVSASNWEDQIALYRLILRRDETPVRDDFCFYRVHLSDVTEVQFALKKLPRSLRPRALPTTVIQFKVRDVGHLVPLLPHTCQPISELRWRTRDHDLNVVLLHVQRNASALRGHEAARFAERTLTDCESSSNETSSSGVTSLSSSVTSCPRSDGKRANRAKNNPVKSRRAKGRSPKSEEKSRAAFLTSSSSLSASSTNDVTPTKGKKGGLLPKKLEYFSLSDSHSDVVRTDNGVFV